MAVFAQPEPALLTIEEYLRTAYEPDCDFVDGHLEERNVGERDHSVLQAALAAWFFNHRKEWKIVVMAEQRTRVSDSRVRLPDVCLVLEDAPRERVTVTPPLLAIEILSPEDRIGRVIKRLDDFLKMGVANVWVIDPDERSAFVYTSGDLRRVAGDTLHVPNSAVFLDLPSIFVALD
jgi:Uma2 family endonuclease